MTPASIAEAKAQQRQERIYAIADLLAGFDDVIFRTATSRDRAHYLDCAGAAIDAATKGLHL